MKMKKTLCALSTLAIAVSVSTTVFAASGINAAEQTILNKLDTTVTVGSDTVKLPNQYKNQAYNYMLSDGVDFTQQQAKDVSAKMDECIALVESEQASSLKDLSSKTQQALLTKAQEAASIVGLVLSFDAANGTVIIKNTNGQVIANSDKTIKATGFDATSIYASMAAFVALLAACGVVAKKKNLFHK